MSTLLKQKEYHNPTGGVTGESTHKLDYSPPPPNAYAKRISLGVHTAPSGNVPFTGTSTTHSDFVYTVIESLPSVCKLTERSLHNTRSLVLYSDCLLVLLQKMVTSIITMILYLQLQLCKISNTM
jgi:hypothetical protein